MLLHPPNCQATAHSRLKTFTLWSRVAAIFWALMMHIGSLSAQMYSFRADTSLMGSHFEFVAVHENEDRCRKAIQAAMQETARIEQLISSWLPTSQTSAINAAASIQPVKVSPELFDLISRSLKVSELTRGAFDISYAAMDALWQFDGSMQHFPDSALVQEAVRLVDYRRIQLRREAQTVFLPHRGMKIGFGAIGKGYAAMRAKAAMLELGIENGLVNAGGDLLAWGSRADGGPWEVGIAHPRQKGRMLAWLLVQDAALVTSGDYERFVVINGQRYAHIIDPRTGYPARHLSSVSVLCPDAELADALATAVYVMGREEGLALINRLRGIECLIVDSEGKMYASDGLELRRE